LPTYHYAQPLAHPLHELRPVHIRRGRTRTDKLAEDIPRSGTTRARWLKHHGHKRNPLALTLDGSATIQPLDSLVVRRRDAALIGRPPQDVKTMRRRDREVEGGGAAAHPHRQEDISRPPGLLRRAFNVGKQKVLRLNLRVQPSAIAQVRKMVPQDVVPASPVSAARASQGMKSAPVHGRVAHGTRAHRREHVDQQPALQLNYEFVRAKGKAQHKGRDRLEEVPRPRQCLRTQLSTIGHVTTRKIRLQTRHIEPEGELTLRQISTHLQG
jgi:hypothetical protein